MIAFVDSIGYGFLLCRRLLVYVERKLFLFFFFICSLKDSGKSNELHLVLCSDLLAVE